jgi:processing peptidase subunit alpha
VATPAPVSTYCGGDYRVAAPGGQTNTMLAFEYQGGWSDFEGSIAVTVLQFLLGGGGSFSSGGPGAPRALNPHVHLAERDWWAAQAIFQRPD